MSRRRQELVEKTDDEFFMLSFLQNSQSGSSVMDSCEGSQLYPPTSPIMLQVNCRCIPSVNSLMSENLTSSCESASRKILKVLQSLSTAGFKSLSSFYVCLFSVVILHLPLIILCCICLCFVSLCTFCGSIWPFFVSLSEYFAACNISLSFCGSLVSLWDCRSKKKRQAGEELMLKMMSQLECFHIKRGCNIPKCPGGKSEEL